MSLSAFRQNPTVGQNVVCREPDAHWQPACASSPSFSPALLLCPALARPQYMRCDDCDCDWEPPRKVFCVAIICDANPSWLMSRLSLSIPSWLSPCDSPPYCDCD
eukprot:CAMPEP_0202809274 /NCGR_PEP_ID=MMETSP1389-20130828/1624_1 /ASSEMBLY_ACC=CAM_ASM_000865 /TAXON_ID=302021 /ORGANISM="Rhodomonas sp., Strain CCMP768" /LENGTH=104 /DNA_ID=CAMNT_0049479833 /DNA_START=427 /DNA_END=738 /DNA_ORIENTATION=+